MLLCYLLAENAGKQLATRPSGKKRGKMSTRGRKKQDNNNRGDEQPSDYEGEASSPAEEEAELVTMASVRKMSNQMLTQQKAHYLEKLDRQTDTFLKFVKVILDSTNRRLDSMNRNVQEIKDSIYYTQ